MIDLHTHVLPGMDDGSRSPEESARMLRELAAQGVTLAAATPHFYAGENSPDRFLRRRNGRRIYRVCAAVPCVIDAAAEETKPTGG